MKPLAMDSSYKPILKNDEDFKEYKYDNCNITDDYFNLTESQIFIITIELSDFVIKLNLCASINLQTFVS